MKRPDRGGFILLEVMLALVILTAGVIVIFQSFRSSLRAFNQSHALFHAGLLMESQMAELERTGKVDSTLNMPSALDALSWEDQVLSSDLFYGQEHLLTLNWGEGPRSQALEQTLYVAK